MGYCKAITSTDNTTEYSTLDTLKTTASSSQTTDFTSSKYSGTTYSVSTGNTNPTPVTPFKDQLNSLYRNSLTKPVAKPEKQNRKRYD